MREICVSCLKEPRKMYLQLFSILMILDTFFIESVYKDSLWAFLKIRLKTPFKRDRNKSKYSTKIYIINFTIGPGIQQKSKSYVNAANEKKKKKHLGAM